MSERRSFDVRPTRTRAQGRGSLDRVRAARGTESSRLREKRRKKRTAGLIIGCVVLLIVLAGGVYALWLPHLRIAEVTAEGPKATEVEGVAHSAIQGTYAYVVPRNSILFVSKDAIRRGILTAYPEISAVSISRSSLTSLSIVVTPRAKAFIWCGATIDEGYPDGSCFDADAEGLVFAQSSSGYGTSTQGADLRIFGALDRTPEESPIGARVVSASAIPQALQFVKAIRGLGVPVSALALRGDEADLWISGPTRIIYVLGKEESAVLLAASVIPTLDLTDGSIAYLDLRFSGKAYVKRHGQ